MHVEFEDHSTVYTFYIQKTPPFFSHFHLRLIKTFKHFQPQKPPVTSSWKQQKQQQQCLERIRWPKGKWGKDRSSRLSVFLGWRPQAWERNIWWRRGTTNGDLCLCLYCVPQLSFYPRPSNLALEINGNLQWIHITKLTFLLCQSLLSCATHIYILAETRQGSVDLL